jgi:hypothetical protein
VELQRVRYDTHFVRFLHYFLLVRVPELVARDALVREVILERIGALYGARVRKELLAELDSE